MHELISSFLDNESRFGRLMTRCGIIIGANLMFVLFSLPMITIGAGLVALYHVMFKTLRGDGELNPFKQFFAGFKANFKQATIVWIVFVALMVFIRMDLSICAQAGGAVSMLRYPLYALGFVIVVCFLFLLPMIAAFEDTIPHLLRNAFYFAIKKPIKSLVILFFDTFPLVLTYSDPQMLPLYAFLWTFFGFGAIALLGATLLLPEMKPFLPKVDICGDFILDDEDSTLTGEDIINVSAEKSQKELLDDMKKLGM